MGDQPERAYHTRASAPGGWSVGRFLLLGFLCLTMPYLAGSTPPAHYGVPPLVAFTPDDYNLAGQCFDVVQTRAGLIYVANGGGILEFDGNRWQRLGMDADQPFLSLAVDNRDRVWSGGLSGIGVLLEQPNGELRYQAVEPRVPDTLAGPKSYWRIRADGSFLYFQTPLALLRYRPDDADPLIGDWDIWPVMDNQNLVMVMPALDKVWVKFNKELPEWLEEDSLVPVPTNQDSLGVNLFHAIAYDKNTVLLTGWKRGLYFYHMQEQVFTKWDAVINDYLGDALIHGSVALPDGRLALTSNPYGIVVYNRSGNVVEVVTRQDGLPSDIPRRAGMVDQGGGFWVPLDYGAARLELSAPFRRLDDKQGLDGAVLGVAVFNGQLYAGTPKNLFRLVPSDKPGRPGRFEPIPGVEHGCYTLRVYGDFLYVCSFAGLVEVDRSGRATTIEGTEGNMFGMGVSNDGNYLFVGSELKGLFRYRLTDRGAEPGVRILEDNRSARYLYHDPLDRLWIITEEGGVNRLLRGHHDPTQSDSVILHVVTDSLGISEKLHDSMIFWRGRLWVATAEGLLGYDADQKRMRPDEELIGVDTGPLASFVYPVVDARNRLYFSQGSRGVTRIDPDAPVGQQIVQPLPPNPTASVVSIATGADRDLAFFGMDDGSILTCDAAGDTLPVMAPTALIRRIETARDSLAQGSVLQLEGTAALSLAWPDRTFRVSWSALPGAGMGTEEFQYRLIGNTEEWSEWSHETYRDFNDLQPGLYRFEVRARNETVGEGPPAMLRIRIQPPWYRTPLAWIAWAALAVLAVWGVVQRRLRSERRRRDQLEALVRQRTAELEKSRKQEQEAEIKAKQMETAYKMAATLAHEFNNPLAVISAACYLAKTEEADEDTRQIMVDKIQPQVERMSTLLKDMMKLDELHEIDYAAGMKILDLRSAREAPPGGENDEK